MALTLNGARNWPDSKALRRVGEIRIGKPAKIQEIFDSISEAVSATIPEIKAYITEHAEFQEIGERMTQEWEKGRTLSLS